MEFNSVDPLKWNFLCLCPRCNYGSLCQYNIEGMSFTSYSLYNQINHSIEIIYFIFTLVIVVSGLPQMIVSFSFAGQQLITWQQHPLFIAYFTIDELLERIPNDTIIENMDFPMDCIENEKDNRMGTTMISRTK